MIKLNREEITNITMEQVIKECRSSAFFLKRILLDYPKEIRILIFYNYADRIFECMMTIEDLDKNVYFKTTACYHSVYVLVQNLNKELTDDILLEINRA